MKNRFSLLVSFAILIALAAVTAQAQNVKRGNISSLKGMTKVFISDSEEKIAIAEYLKAKSPNLTVVSERSSADFVLGFAYSTAVDSFNSPDRQSTAGKIIAGIEGPMATHPNEVNSGQVVGRQISLYVENRPQGSIVWSRSAAAPVARRGVPAYTTVSTETTLNASLSGARRSLLDRFLKDLKNVR